MNISLFNVLMLFVGVFFVAVGCYMTIRYNFVYGGPYIIGGAIVFLFGAEDMRKKQYE